MQKKQLHWVDEDNCFKPNAFLAAISGKRYSLAIFLFSRDPTMINNHGKHQILSAILSKINLHNSIASFVKSSALKELGRRAEDAAWELFQIIIDGITREEINKIDLFLGFSAVRTGSTCFMESLLDHGLNIENRYHGCTPFLSCLVNNAYNVEMMDRLIRRGANIHAVTKDDNVVDDSAGYNLVTALMLNEKNCPDLPPPKGLNHLEILQMIYNHLVEHEVIPNNSNHPIYQVMDYFKLPYTKEEGEECCICFQKSKKCVLLDCGHHLHAICGAFIQDTHSMIACPLYRSVSCFEGKELSLNIILKEFMRTKVIKVFPNKTRISEIIEAAR
jgi:hypothetical protein